MKMSRSISSLCMHDHPLFCFTSSSLGMKERCDTSSSHEKANPGHTAGCRAWKADVKAANTFNQNKPTRGDWMEEGGGHSHVLHVLLVEPLTTVGLEGDSQEEVVMGVVDGGRVCHPSAFMSFRVASSG